MDGPYPASIPPDLARQLGGLQSNNPHPVVGSPDEPLDALAAAALLKLQELNILAGFMLQRIAGEDSVVPPGPDLPQGTRAVALATRNELIALENALAALRAQLYG